MTETTKDLEVTGFCEKVSIPSPNRFKPIIATKAGWISSKIVSGFLEEAWISMTFLEISETGSWHVIARTYGFHGLERRIWKESYFCPPLELFWGNTSASDLEG